jgi:MoxR-like ATPase
MVAVVSSLTPIDSASNAAEALQQMRAAVSSVVQGKPQAVRAALIVLLARGHLLVEDIPGVGKTTLARSLAAAVGGVFRRIQFTSDLLPSDIVGVSIYDQSGRVFEFKKGPLFANIVLADEINRTTPRTQSALLEAMSEGHISVDDTTHALEQPFMVIATQNPAEQYGTYPLPESQMDRFLLRISIGYPELSIERNLLRVRGSADPVAAMRPVMSVAAVESLQAATERVTVPDGLLDYAMAIVTETRRHPGFAIGVSTRGALAWYRAAQASAILEQRQFCLPDDFKGLAVAALAHRCVLAGNFENGGKQRTEAERIIQEIIDRVAVPV